MFIKTLRLVAALILFTLPAQAEGIHAMHGFARETPPTAKVGGAFVTLMNDGTDDVFIGVETPASARAELHSHTMDGGVMKMREVEGGIAIPSGETVELKPGGLHIMLMGLKKPLKHGEMLPLILKFKSGASIKINLPIKKIGSMGMDHSNH